MRNLCLGRFMEEKKMNGLKYLIDGYYCGCGSELKQLDKDRFQCDNGHIWNKTSGKYE